MKALEKDRARRYGTASEVTADVSKVSAQRTGTGGTCDGRHIA